MPLPNMQTSFMDKLFAYGGPPDLIEDRRTHNSSGLRLAIAALMRQPFSMFEKPGQVGTGLSKDLGYHNIKDQTRYANGQTPFSNQSDPNRSNLGY